MCIRDRIKGGVWRTSIYLIASCSADDVLWRQYGASKITLIFKCLVIAGLIRRASSADWRVMIDYSLMTSGIQFMVIADALPAFVNELPSYGRSLGRSGKLSVL